jgi:hypothetical protein
MFWKGTKDIQKAKAVNKFSNLNLLVTTIWNGDPPNVKERTML